MKTFVDPILSERYKKWTWTACVLLLLVYLFFAYATVKDWQTTRTRLDSPAFAKVYEQAPNYYDTYGFSASNNQQPHSLNDFRKKNMTFFNSEGTSTEHLFYSENSYRFIPYLKEKVLFAPIAMAICGFLLFFIDLKTNFNPFLFSSGLSRKQLFWKKILQVGGPLLGTLLIGKLILAGAIYFMIPSAYMNATLGQLLFSAFTSSIIGLLYFALGVIVGTLAGNLVVAPLLLIGVISSSLAIPFAAGNMHHFYQVWHHGFDSILPIWTWFNNVLSITIARTSGHPVVMLSLVGISMLLLWISQHAYTKISLEQNGQVLLVPRFRLPIFVVTVGYCWLWYLTSGDLWQKFVSIRINPAIGSYSMLIAPLLVPLLISLVSCTLLYYFPEVKRLYTFFLSKKKKEDTVFPLENH